MTKIFLSNPLLVLSAFLSLSEISLVVSQRRSAIRQFSPIINKVPMAPPVVCTHDSLLVYHDCRLCVCPRPNRLAKCFIKNCDLRTKDSGQCPPATLRMEQGRNCSIGHSPYCKIDQNCPGDLLCCFDFCGGTRCVEPVPLDGSTGIPKHRGRAYKHP